MKRFYILMLIFFFLQGCSEVSTNKPEANSSADGEDSVDTIDNGVDDMNTVDNTAIDSLCISALSSGSVVNQTLNPLQAIIATTAADFSSGAHSVLSADANNGFNTLNNLVPTGSDLTVAVFGNHFYRIERAFSGNNITKFAINNPQVPIWQYSVNDPASAVVANPHDMVFVSETKAYVLRYDSTKAWIVNPSATQESDFKIGEIDLSAYGGINGIPDMDSAVIVNGKLFITLQRLEGPTFQPDNISYLAVIDINTDQEIDVGITGDALKGIPLQTRNPTKIIYHEGANKIFVQSSGSTLAPLVYVSGIESIHPTTYVSRLILDDGDELSHPFGIIFKMALASPDVLYFVGYKGFRDTTLYVMNLTTEEILETKVAPLLNGDISELTADRYGRVWVGDNANATVRIIDTNTCEEIGAVSTNLNPAKIVFSQ